MSRNKRFDKGRLVECSEEDLDFRTPYRRDYARVIHSPAFRRMQFKTQLFPGHESDFIRNRLTHSLEVAQISKTIALKLKKKYPKIDIDPDVCEIAGLLHDIGHPPFGHVGEDCLDEKMKHYGGFEANAQTIRIITYLEKKEWLPEPIIPKGFPRDFTIERVGLNLTYRVILSCIKYWNEIPQTRDERTNTRKGIYSTEWPLVQAISEIVLKTETTKYSRTIESWVMDDADDIAYSTYDIDDSFKSGFLTPLDIINADDSKYEKISSKLKKTYPRLTPQDCRSHMQLVFHDIWREDEEKIREIARKSVEDKGNFDVSLETVQETLRKIFHTSQKSSDLSANGYLRNQFTSQLINNAINSVDILDSTDRSILTIVGFNNNLVKGRVDVLKEFTMQYLINSPTFCAIAERQKYIINTVFDTLLQPEGYKLMPSDYRSMWLSIGDDDNRKKRLICDYIAGMTDRYLIEFCNRIKSTEGVSVFRPYY